MKHSTWEDESPEVPGFNAFKTKNFKVIRISGIATGVGFSERLKDGSGEYSEKVCETLFDTGNDKKDAAESEKWANIIAEALNKHYNQ